MISEYFKNDVANNDLLGVAISLKDSVLFDKTLGEFEELLAYAEANFDNLYQEHNGDVLDTNAMDQEQLKKQLSMLTINFSSERVDYVRAICKKIYGDSSITSSDEATVEKFETFVEEVEENKKSSKLIPMGIGAVVLIAVIIILIFLLK